MTLEGKRLIVAIILMLLILPLSVGIIPRKGVAEGPTTYETWQLNTAGAVASLMPIQDLSGDKVNDLVVLSGDRIIYAVDGLTGQKIWNYTADNFYPWLAATTSASLDLSGDSKSEIFIVAKNGLVLLLDGASGKQLWNYSVTTTRETSYKYGDSCFPETRGIYLTSDISNDGLPDPIIISGSGDECSKDDEFSVVALDSKTGREIWAFVHQEDYHGLKEGTKGSIPAALIDINGDGTADVVIIDDHSVQYSVDGSNGKLINSKKLAVYGAIWNLLALPDITGDGIGDALAVEFIDQSGEGPNYASVETIDVAANKVIWQKKLGDGSIHSGAIYSATWLTDRNLTSAVMRVVITERIDDQQNLDLLDAKTGTLVWQFSLGSNSAGEDFKTYYAIGIIPDLDGNGHDEIAISKTDSTLYLLNANDAESVWSYPVGGVMTNVAFLSKQDDKQKYIVVGNSHAQVLALAGLTPIPTRLTIGTSGQTVTLSTDLVISGVVSPSFPGDFVLVHYIKPSGSLQDRSVEIGKDGSFTDIVKPESLGTWQVFAEFRGKGYYLDSKSQTISFVVKSETRNSIFDLSVESEDAKTKLSYPISYLIEGANVTDMSINKEQKSLDISLKSLASNQGAGGTLRVELPKSIVDTWQPRYHVFVDGQAVSYQDLPSGNVDIRILSIPFSVGAKQIQIQGTYVVPEFSETVLIILALTLVAAMILGSKNNLRKDPRP